MKINRFLPIFIILLVILDVSCERNMNNEEEKELEFIPVVAKYDCTVYWKKTNTSTMTVTRGTYQDTISVTSMEDPERIKISVAGIVPFNSADSTFGNSAIRIFGKFYQDSIYLSYWQTPVALNKWDYYGKKIPGE